MTITTTSERGPLEHGSSDQKSETTTAEVRSMLRSNSIAVTQLPAQGLVYVTCHPSETNASEEWMPLTGRNEIHSA